MAKILRLLSTTKKYGGDLFEDEMQMAFSNCDHYVEVLNPVPSQGTRLYRVPKYLQNLKRLSNQNKDFDFVFRAMNHVFFMDSNPKQLVIAYHYDTTYCHPLVAAHHYLTLRSLIHHKDKVHKLIVIAKYWRDYFFNLGFKNVETIYCGFDKKNFVTSEQALEKLRLKINPRDKKIVYIGNPQRKKGADKVYKALKHRDDILLITSGNKDVDLPCLNLELSYPDYLAMLKLSCAVITFSQFKEGWNRVAHEAMMMGVPVIGSGLGGMSELLLGGGQMKVTNAKDLSWALDRVMQNNEIGLQGKEYAETFTRERFETSCNQLIS